MNEKHEKKQHANQPVWSHATGFASLDGHDVISAKVSDHHPIIHDGVFFWNIMMKCNTRGCGRGFNNGFGIIERDNDYTARLVRVARVIAEAVYRDPSIDAISLCEGPIKSEHVTVLFNSLMKFPFMARFFRDDMFHKPTAKGHHWGLLMLADRRYTVSKIKYDLIDNNPELANRFQLWKLMETNNEKYMAVAHLPFAGDEHKTEKMALSTNGHKYGHLIKTLLDDHRNDSLIFCADFNFNPYLISQWQDRALDKISSNNSILLTLESPSEKQVKTVTVDGVLLSTKEKQKYQSSYPEPQLFGRHKNEYRFFKSQMNHVVKDIEHTEFDDDGVSLHQGLS